MTPTPRLLAAAALLACAAACHRDKDSDRTSASPADPPPAASSAAETAKLPASFPDYTPVYPGATLVRTEQTTTDAGKAANVALLETKDALPKVQAWYDAVGKGFNVVGEEAELTGKSYWWDAAKKGGDRDLRIRVRALRKGAEVRISVEGK
jgi:hypothetical protein